MLRITCPKCQSRLKLSPGAAGKTVACPRCQTALVVPLLREAPDPPPAEAGGGGKVLLGVLALLVVLAAAGAGGYLWYKNRNRADNVAVADNSDRERGEREAKLPPPGSDAQEQAGKTKEIKEEDPKPTAKKETAVTEPTAQNSEAEPIGPPMSRSVGGPPADPKPVTAARPVGARHALLVGVEKYDSKSLRDLSYAESDVEELAQALLKGGYRPEHVVLLTKQRGDQDAALLPTAERIRAHLARLLEKCQDGDLVLVAFAGHGIQRKNTFYFCPYQAKLEAADTLVSLNEVYQKLEQCRAGFKLLLADACRNDPGTRGGRPVEDLDSVTRPQELRPPGNMMAFYSCSAGQFAFEEPPLRHGVFFHYLIEGLKGQADFDGDGQIIREELEHFVKKQVRSYVAQTLKKEQWPHLAGESNDQRPLVTYAEGKEPPAKPKLAGPAPKLSSSVLLHEDFRDVPPGALPRGWDSETYVAAKGKDGRAHLEVKAKSGQHYLRLPKLPIEGDFFVECEFVLGTHHHLDVQLEGHGTGVSAGVTFQGITSFQDVRTRDAENYKPGEPNRFLLVREGGIYRVSINNEVVLTDRVLDAHPFEHVRLGLTAGEAHTHARLYAVKVGTLAPLQGKPAGGPAVAGKVLLYEDFRGVRRGDKPGKWEGEAFSVTRDEGGRSYLEVRTKEGQHFVNLPPKLGVEGDFFVECEFVLGTHHHLDVRLEGAGETVEAKVTFQGVVSLGENIRPKDAEKYAPGAINRFRLVREGNRYLVSLNDVEVLQGPLPYKGPFRDVRLSLTAGEAHTNARLYAVKVGTLAPGRAAGAKPDKPEPAGPLTEYREEFQKVRVGSLPDRWEPSPRGIIGVQKVGSRTALELTSQAPGGDAVQLPPVSLKGNFFLECEFDLTDKDTALVLQLEGRPSNMVILRVGGDHKMVMQENPKLSADVTKMWNPRGQTNRLQLERRGEIYLVKLNGKDVGKLGMPFAAPGELEAIKLGLAITNKDDQSPKVYSIRFTPVEAGDGKQ